MNETAANPLVMATEESSIYFLHSSCPLWRNYTVEG